MSMVYICCCKLINSSVVQDTAITKNDEILRKELIEEFGEKLEIYTDCKNRKRLGVAHIIKVFEKEYHYTVGTPVEREVCEERFDQDIRLRLAVCMNRAMFTSFGKLPQNVQRLIIIVMFEMSIQEFFFNFTDFRSAINDHDWGRAADILVDNSTLMCNLTSVRRLAEQLRKLDPDAKVISGDNLSSVDNSESEDNNSESEDNSESENN